MILVVVLVAQIAPRLEALEGGLSVQPGMIFIEDESSDVRKYSFAGALDADLKIIAGLFADINLMYYITSIKAGAGGNIQGFYPSFGAKYKFNIKDKFYPFLLLGFGPYYHRAVINSGLIGVPHTTDSKVKFGMNVGAGAEIMFSKTLGMDFTIKQYFTFFPGKVLKVLTVAPGFKVRF